LVRAGGDSVRVDRAGAAIESLRYGGRKVIVRIADGHVEGKFSPRARVLVLDWWNLHREELMENWRLAKEQKELKPIPPLE
jgi:hypothetical protein